MHLNRPALVIPTSTTVAVLLCSLGGLDKKLVGLALRMWGEGYVGRTSELVVLRIRASSMRFRSMVSQMHVMRERPLQLRNDNIVFRRLLAPFEVTSLDRAQTASGPAWRRSYWGGCTIFQLSDDALGNEDICYNFEIAPRRGVSVTFHRLPLADIPGFVGPLRVEVSAITLRRPSAGDERKFFRAIPAGSQWSDGQSSYAHVMATPSDSWAVEVEDLPRIYIRVERKGLDGEGSGVVDIVDLFMCPDGSAADRAKRAIQVLGAG